MFLFKVYVCAVAVGEVLVNSCSAYVVLLYSINLTPAGKATPKVMESLVPPRDKTPVIESV